MSVLPLSILVADDNVDAATTLAQLLALDGHRVEVAFDGQQALQQAVRSPPDVALLDLQMPHLGGCEVAQRLREQALRPRMLLIALSGSSVDAAPSCEAVDAHFTKPVDCLRLERYIHQWRACAMPAGRQGAA